VLCARALLDAAALASTGGEATAHPGLTRAAGLLDALAARLEGGAGPGGLSGALAEALDVEIRRWETRARSDPDARAVYRAFLGVRELLWELGVRGAGPGAPAPFEGGSDLR